MLKDTSSGDVRRSSSTGLLNNLYCSPVWLILMVAVAIIAANVIGIIVLFYSPEMSKGFVFVLDVVLVMSMLAPILFFLVFRPLVVQITERKQAESSLMESEERFHSFFENSLEGMLVATPNGIVKAANRAACAILGVSEDEIIRRGCKGFLDGSDPKIYHFFYEREQTGTIKGEFTFRRKDGTPFPVELSAAIYKNHHGEIKISVLFSDISDRKANEQELLASRSQLRALMAHLQSVREEERTAIAREVHDELGQVLASVQMGVSLLADDYRDHQNLTARIGTFEQMLDGAIKSVQRISAELRPMMLDTLGLADAVEWQAKEFQKNSSIVCKPVIILDNEQYQRDVATAVFRIFQEALTNVIRHSRADRVDVLLEERNNRLVLVVKDNGRGLSREEMDQRDSFGIMGMRERAYSLGGRVRMLAASSGGTVIVAHIPVNPVETARCPY